MRKLMTNLAWVPFGFPLGWISARVADGKFEVALLDLLGCLALIGLLSLVGWLEDRSHPRSP